jgi:hypothetical protein
MSKDLEPRSLDEQDMFSKGEVTHNRFDNAEDGIEEINSRAEDSVEDYKPGFTRQRGVDEA